MLTLFGRSEVIGKLRYYFLDRNYSLTIRVVLVGMCLALSVAAGFTFRGLDTGGNPMVAMFPLLVAVAVAGFVFLYMNMHLGAVLVLSLSLFVHEGISTGTATKLTFTFLFLMGWSVIWLMQMFLVNRKVEIRPSTANIPAFLFMCVAVISYFWSMEYVEATVKHVFEERPFPRLMSTVVLIISPLTYMLFAAHIRSMKMLRIVVMLFVVAGIINLVTTLTGVSVPLLNDRGQFAAWVGILAMGQVLFNQQLDRRLRILLLSVTGGWVFITFGTAISWLSGWVPLLLGLGVLLWFYSRKLFIIATVLVISVYVINLAFFAETFQEENTISGETRANAWSEVFKLTGKHLLFGTGPAGYEMYFSTYMGFMYQLSHNNYIDIIAQTGITGTVTFMAFWLAQGIMVWRMYKLLPRGTFEHGFGISLIGCYVIVFPTMMLGDWVTPFAYTQGLAGLDYTIWHWMVAGLTVAFLYLLKEQPAQSVEMVPVRMNESL